MVVVRVIDFSTDEHVDAFQRVQIIITRAVFVDHGTRWNAVEKFRYQIDL